MGCKLIIFNNVKHAIKYAIPHTSIMIHWSITVLFSPHAMQNLL